MSYILCAFLRCHVTASWGQWGEMTSAATPSPEPQQQRRGLRGRQGANLPPGWRCFFTYILFSSAMILTVMLQTGLVHSVRFFLSISFFVVRGLCFSFFVLLSFSFLLFFSFHHLLFPVYSKSFLFLFFFLFFFYVILLLVSFLSLLFHRLLYRAGI